MAAAAAAAVDGWAVEDVCQWLETEGLGKYKDRFVENRVDGPCLLELTQADIKAELEIPVLQDRKDLWTALQRLKGAAPHTPPAASIFASSIPSPSFQSAASPDRRSPTLFAGLSPAAMAALRLPSPRAPFPTAGVSPRGFVSSHVTHLPDGCEVHTTTSTYSSSTLETRQGGSSGGAINDLYTDVLRNHFPKGMDTSIPLPSPGRHAPAAEAGGPCGRCGKAVGAAFVKAFGRTFHEDCFLCANCGLPIRDSKYAKRGTDPYHADCLALQQGDLCAKCLTVITGTVTTALDRKWHVDCFLCGKCRRPITDAAFAAVGDVPYHSACEPGSGAGPVALGPPPPYPVASQPCAACLRPIDGGVTTTALGKVWHSECFCCGKCQRPIREDKFKTDQGVPFHINCKLGDSTIFCRGCHLEINGGDIVNAMDEVWHPECFKCHRCGIRIMSERFARDNGRPIHTHCKHLPR